jgi:hypothetical protein
MPPSRRTHPVMEVSLKESVCACLSLSVCPSDCPAINLFVFSLLADLPNVTIKLVFVNLSLLWNGIGCEQIATPKDLERGEKERK